TRHPPVPAPLKNRRVSSNARWNQKFRAEARPPARSLPGLKIFCRARGFLIACLGPARLWTDVPRRTGSGRASRPNGLALRLLLVTQRGIEIVERIPHRFDTVQHRPEPLADRGEARRRRQEIVLLTRRFQLLADPRTRILEHLQRSPLGVIGVKLCF